MGLQLGLDTGGTYTDAVLVNDAFDVLGCAKSLTTHTDLIIGLRGAVDQVLPSDVSHIELVCLSTTLATNALVEGRGRPVALVLIGFTQPLLERAGLSEALGTDPVLMVSGGHTASGHLQASLDTARVGEFVRQVDSQVEAFALCAVFAVRNPEHELQVQSLIETLTAKPVTCGHHLSSGLDAPRRALTALLNARLIPMIDALLQASRALLDEKGVDAPLMVVKGDGSLMSEQLARRCPVDTILSGPAASVVGAQFLCADEDLLIADMGGTTTDIALIRHGQPSLNADGATVGGWRTMVQAIDVSTYGLGGDSAVVYDRQTRQFQMGPQRVLPLSLLVHQHPQCLEDLEAQLALPMSTTHSAQFVMLHSTRPADLSYQQQELYAQLGDGPIALQRLFSDQTQERALQRMEQRGIVLRAGFTPSDASHILGVQSDWSLMAARMGARLLMRYSESNLGAGYTSEDQFATEVTQRVVDLTSLALSDALRAIEGKPLTRSQRELLEHSLQHEQESHLSLKPRLQLPVIGLGAPAASYYPQSADQLQASLRTPNYAHVANALGAVVGSIRQQQMIVVVPAGGARVSVMMPDGPTEYDTLELGAEAAERVATECVIEKARLAGAENPDLTAERVDNIVKHGDTAVFFESRITVTASGRPAVSMACEDAGGP